jgi:Amt family ammonium transporter
MYNQHDGTIMRDRLLQEARVLDDAELAYVIDYTFVLICGFLCFLLQAGFGLLEVGGVRAKNAKNIMIKKIMDACVSALAYWVFGYAFAYGEGTNPFIGE